MAVKTYKGLKAKADKLFSQAIRSTGYCEAYGYAGIQCTPQLQTMHIISRRYNSVRTDTRNAMCGCASHHRFFTDHPREFSKFLTDTWAQTYYDEVYEKAHRVVKVDWDARIQFLKQIINEEMSLPEARAEEGEQ